MREVLFRVWDGKTMHLPDSNYAYHLRWLRVTGWALWWKWENNEKVIWEEFGRNHKFPLMQFTGLLDKNGGKIYFQDIVEYETTEGIKNRATVTWSEELCCVMIGGMPYPQLYQSAFIQPSKCVFEIIGNIYQSALINALNDKSNG